LLRTEEAEKRAELEAAYAQQNRVAQDKIAALEAALELRVRERNEARGQVVMLGAEHDMAALRAVLEAIQSEAGLCSRPKLTLRCFQETYGCEVVEHDDKRKIVDLIKTSVITRRTPLAAAQAMLAAIRAQAPAPEEQPKPEDMSTLAKFSELYALCSNAVGITTGDGVTLHVGRKRKSFVDSVDGSAVDQALRFMRRMEAGN
jgi:hypothetical protein